MLNQPILDSYSLKRNYNCRRTTNVYLRIPDIYYSVSITLFIDKKHLSSKYLNTYI